jgi:murein DD-endopeptidase MepM/ murein hydrolase activator NlpD
MISGKGYFIWRAERVLAQMNATPADAARAARAAGIQHVVVKIADGDHPYPLTDSDTDGRKEAATAALIKALQDVNIVVLGYAFVYGQRYAPEDQARAFASRARTFGLSKLVINAEDIGTNRWSISDGAERARKLVYTLREEMGAEALLALSSYRFPKFHPNFPFDAFMAGCDIAMPQVYWVALGGQEGDAARNLLQSVEEYRARYPDKPVVPTGAAFGEKQSDNSYWSATPRQVYLFLSQAKAMELPAVNFWSWEHAFGDPANSRVGATDLWEIISGFNYDAGFDEDGPPPEEIIDLQLQVGGSGYYDGVHDQFPKAALKPFARNGLAMKYADSVGGTPSSVWSIWRPDIVVSGMYNISAWVPGENATTGRARYHIHGVMGESEPVVVDVDQRRYSDVWVSLGAYLLNANDPSSGQVNLTNFTGEEDRRVAFAGMRWQKVAPQVEGETPLADGFDAPVGTESQRRAPSLWPGDWIDVNPYGRMYTLRGRRVFHTGADLNLNVPAHDSDARAPVYAIGNGEVTFAGFRNGWGNIVVIRHDPASPGGPRVYSRYAHLERVHVRAGDQVQRGLEIGRIGSGDPNSPVPFHLHFDISLTDALFENPGDWPGLDYNRIERDYVDPFLFITEHRPR